MQGMNYLWVAIGSALGGVLRYALTRATIPTSTGVPWGTVLINVVGSFVIGFFGTLTLQTGRYPASDNLRLFVMVGICGGFTTFSSFSLQTFDLMRTGQFGRAMINVLLSVVLCVGAVAAGHAVAHRAVAQDAIAEPAEEEYTG
jgi:CrcB protein